VALSLIGALLWGWPLARRNAHQLLAYHALLGPESSAENRIPTQLAAAPEAADAYALGLIAAQKGADLEAEQWWAQALRRDARYISQVRGQAPANAALAQLATEVDPTSALAWDWRGNTVVTTAPAQAVTFYQRALELDRLNQLGWEKLIGLAEGQGQRDLARAAAQHACDLNPQRNGSCLTAARWAFEAADWALCIEYNERGSYPENPLDWAKLIRAAQHLHQPEAAARYRQQAAQEYPADYDALLQQLP
jgi:hypothetical protein